MIQKLSQYLNARCANVVCKSSPYIHVPIRADYLTDPKHFL